MNESLDIIEFRATESMEEVFYRLQIATGVEYLLIVDESTAFTLFDEQNNIYSESFKGSQPFVTIRFKAQNGDTYRARLKGYDSKLNEICSFNLNATFNDTILSKNEIKLFFILASILLIGMSYDGLKISSIPSTSFKTTVQKQKKVLFIGSTEKYCDPDVLLNRFQRYYDVTIDCETYSNKSLKELLRLLHRGKISCIVTSIIDFNTSSIYWSDVYAIDNLGGNGGLRLGILKSESNIQLIRQFNE